MKTYLDVPIESNNRAKGLGARYDMAKKQWYCPDGFDLYLFREWLPKEISKWLGKSRRRAFR